MGVVVQTIQLDAATGFRSELSGLAITAAAGARVTEIGKQAGDCRSWRKNAATSVVTSGDHRPLETTKSTPSGSRAIPLIRYEVRMAFDEADLHESLDRCAVRVSSIATTGGRGRSYYVMSTQGLFDLRFVFAAGMSEISLALKT